jgi:hypothetical protein
MQKKFRNSLFLTGAAIVAFAAMVLYMLGLKGTKGFFTWYMPIPLLPVALLVILPFALALLAGFFTEQSGIAARILRWISCIGAVLVLFASCGFSGFLHFAPRAGSVERPKLALIEPEAGIVPRNATPAGGAGSAPFLRVSISSDAHWGSARANASARESILKGIASANPARDAFFFLGDGVELGMITGQTKAEISDLERLIPGVPFRPIAGNHETIAGGEFNYKRAFFPAGMKSDSGSPYYYSVKAGEATFIVVDLPWGTENYDKRQAAWLEKTLAAIPQDKPVIVLSHSYFYASGYNDPRTGAPWYDHPENIPAICPLLEKYKVDLVVSGHNHYMELLAKNGVNYAIIGSMGGIPDPDPSYTSPASLWLSQGGFGWLDLDIDASAILMTFRDENGLELKTARIPVAR